VHVDLALHRKDCDFYARVSGNFGSPIEGHGLLAVSFEVGNQFGIDERPVSVVTDAGRRCDVTAYIDFWHIAWAGISDCSDDMVVMIDPRVIAGEDRAIRLTSLVKFKDTEIVSLTVNGDIRRCPSFR
jgi:hypothetical protein